MELEHYEIWRGEADIKHQQLAEVRAELEPKPGALEVRSAKAIFVTTYFAM